MSRATCGCGLKSHGWPFTNSNSLSKLPRADTFVISLVTACQRAYLKWVVRQSGFFRITLFKRKILDSSKLKEFANDNFKSDENGRHFSKKLENTVGKGDIVRYEQFPLFPQCFQDLCCIQVYKTRACLEKG